MHRPRPPPPPGRPPKRRPLAARPRGARPRRTAPLRGRAPQRPPAQQPPRRRAGARRGAVAAKAAARCSTDPRALTLTSLPVASLDALARALAQGRLAVPYDAAALGRYVGPAGAPVAAELERLRALGGSPALLAEHVALARRSAGAEPPSLVWSGPGDEGSVARDTGVVVRELFAQARRRVLIVGFAVYQGRDIFRVAGRPQAPGVLRPAFGGAGRTDARLAARQVRGRRRCARPGHLGELHGGGAGTQHRGRRAAGRSRGGGGAHRALRSAGRPGGLLRLPGS